RDRVNLHLVSPRSIDGPQVLVREMRQAELLTQLRNGCLDIEREVGNKHFVTVEDEAVRPEKADGCAVAVDAFKIAELRDHPSVRRLGPQDLVGLVCPDT